MIINYTSHDYHMQVDTQTYIMDQYKFTKSHVSCQKNSFISMSEWHLCLCYITLWKGEVMGSTVYTWRDSRRRRAGIQIQHKHTGNMRGFMLKVFIKAFTSTQETWKESNTKITRYGCSEINKQKGNQISDFKLQVQAQRLLDMDAVKLINKKEIK